jgi:hypothetical protein
LNKSNYRGFLSFEYKGEADEFITIPKLITSIKNKMMGGKNMILNWDKNYSFIFIFNV